MESRGYTPWTKKILKNPTEKFGQNDPLGGAKRHHHFRLNRIKFDN